MEPTQSPATAPSPIVGQALVEYVRNNRQTSGQILAGLAVVFLILTGFLVSNAFRTSPSSEKPADKSLNDSSDLENPPELPKGTSSPASQRQGDYNVGWVASLLAFIVIGMASVWLFASPPAPGEDKQRSEIRQAILVVGGVLGIIVILTGLILFYRWSESLHNWFDKGEDNELRWALIPLLMAIVGSGLIFLAVQPARAEERNHSLIRKLVFGANLVLTTLLLLVALVVSNVLFSIKMPNKLDTTATGFYSISDTTKNLLKRLEQPVTAYAVLERDESIDQNTNDIRQLLLSCEDASNGKFKVKFLNSGTNNTELRNLRSKYPQLDLVLDQRTVRGAILLATGEGEMRHAVIPDSELFDPKGKAFLGESRLYKEIAFLADSQIKPVIYFTQSNGEMDISGMEAGKSDHTATRLKAYLEKNYLDVRPLSFGTDNPVIPDDATMIVMAEPRIPFTDAAIGAFRKYMSNPTKKGKLIFFSGSAAGPDGKMIKTGIEPFLADLNVRLGNQFIYNNPTQSMPIVEGVLVAFTRSAGQNPILQSIIKVSDTLQFIFPRQVDPLTTNPNLQATVLMGIIGTTWLEDEKPVDLQATVDELRQSAKVREAKQFRNIPRPVAVIVSEGAVGRAVVFGNSFIFSDEYARLSAGAQSPLTFDLFGVTIDWLRDRSTSIAASGIESKKYTEYTFPPPASVDNTRLLGLPLILGILTVVGLGAGVWVIRRK